MVEINNIAKYYGYTITTDINDNPKDTVKGVVISSDIPMNIIEHPKFANQIIVTVKETDLIEEDMEHIENAVKINANSAIMIEKSYIRVNEMVVSLFSNKEKVKERE